MMPTQAQKSAAIAKGLNVIRSAVISRRGFDMAHSYARTVNKYVGFEAINPNRAQSDIRDMMTRGKT